MNDDLDFAVTFIKFLKRGRHHQCLMCGALVGDMQTHARWHHDPRSPANPGRPSGKTSEVIVTSDRNGYPRVSGGRG